MRIGKEAEKLLKENVNQNESCSLCRESAYKVGEKTGYGAVIFKIGNKNNGWFATLSPQTGGSPKSDFTIQLMPISHLTHFSQIDSYRGMAKNFGVSFSKVCRAMTMILMQNEGLLSNAKEKRLSVPVASYGKCTTWEEKKEHLHIKVFPFRGNIGQPYTVDSSFGKKEVFVDKTGKEFVKMVPVKKTQISKKRFDRLARSLIKLLK